MAPSGGRAEPVRAIRLSAADNVANVLADVPRGTPIAAALDREILNIIAATDIPFGFKVALRDIAGGAPVIKYGEPIGRASVPIAAGELSAPIGRSIPPE